SRAPSAAPPPRAAAAPAASGSGSRAPAHRWPRPAPAPPPPAGAPAPRARAEKAVDRGGGDPERAQPGLAPDALLGRGQLAQLEAAHQPRRKAGRPQQGDQEARLSGLVAFALRQGQ